MKVSFTGPEMGPSVTVYLTDPAFGGERAFRPGADLDTDGLEPATQKTIAELVAGGYALLVEAPAQKGDE